MLYQAILGCIRPAVVVLAVVVVVDVVAQVGAALTAVSPTILHVHVTSEGL